VGGGPAAPLHLRGLRARGGLCDHDRPYHPR